MPRSDIDSCGRENCQDGGAACPVGTTCERERAADQWMVPEGDQGSCKPPRGIATCGGKTRCPAHRPICVVLEGAATCEGLKSDKLGLFVALYFNCTRHGDRNGEEACMYGLRSQSTVCGRWGRGQGNSLVCDPGGKQSRKATEAELARVCGTDQICRAELFCFPRKELAWLGVLATSKPSDEERMP